MILADQGLNTLTNFVLSYLVLRAVSTSAYGAFAIVYLIYVFALLATRALGGEPQLVRWSYCSDMEWRQASARTVGLAAVIGVIAGAIALVAASATGGSLRAELWPLGVGLPGLLVQDAWRYTFLSVGRARHAVANDVVWVAAQAVLMAVVFVLLPSRDRVSLLILAWGAAGSIAACFGIYQARLWPRPTETLVWLRAHQDLAPRFAVESLVDRGTSQLAIVNVGAIAGLVALGQLNTALLVWGPFNMIAMGLFAYVVPEGVRVRRSRPGRLRGLVWLTGVGLACVSLACGALAYFLPISWAVRLFGRQWPAVRTLVPWVAVARALGGIGLGSRIGLRVLAAARESLVVRSVAGVVVLAAGAVGAALDGALGFCIGFAVSSGLAAGLWAAQFERINRRALVAAPGLGPGVALPEVASEGTSVGTSILRETEGRGPV